MSAPATLRDRIAIVLALLMCVSVCTTSTLAKNPWLVARICHQSVCWLEISCGVFGS